MGSSAILTHMRHKADGQSFIVRKRSRAKGDRENEYPRVLKPRAAEGICTAGFRKPLLQHLTQTQ